MKKDCDMKLQGGTGGCPSEEELVSFAENALGKRRTAQITDHLIRCESCLDLVAGLARISADLQQAEIEEVTDDVAQRVLDKVKLKAAQNFPTDTTLSEKIRTILHSFGAGSYRLWYSRAFPTLITASLLLIVVALGGYFYLQQTKVNSLVAKGFEQAEKSFTGLSHHNFRVAAIEKISFHDFAKTTGVNTVPLDETVDAIKKVRNPGVDGDKLIIHYALYKGLPDESLPERFYRVLRFMPDDPQVLTNRGVYFATKQEWTKAIADFQRCLTISPDYRPALFNLIYCYKLMKNEGASSTLTDETIETYFQHYTALEEKYGNKLWLDSLQTLLGVSTE